MNLLCKILGHRYQVWQTFNNKARARIICPRCHRSWGFHKELMAVVPWDQELEDLETKIFRNKVKALPWLEA